MKPGFLDDYYESNQSEAYEAVRKTSIQYVFLIIRSALPTSVGLNRQLPPTTDKGRNGSSQKTTQPLIAANVEHSRWGKGRANMGVWGNKPPQAGYSITPHSLKGDRKRER